MPNEEKKVSNWEERFDETKFAKEGGSCFECCDYEEMYKDLKSFIASVRAEAYAEGFANGLEIAKGCVPNAAKASSNDKWEHGWNSCRAMIIFNLNELTDKS